MPNRLLAALCGLLAMFSFAAPAQAYWEYGHETVARIAWLQMRPDTRAKVAALLRQGRLLETPACPVATIEQASVWADCIKPLGDRFSYAYSWHYQNVDVCKPFDLKAACKDGNCVSAQIECTARILADRQALSGGSVEDWSREGWEAARRYAYTSLVGDPCGPKPDARPTLTEDKVRALIPVLRRQILAGGLRVAAAR